MDAFPRARTTSIYSISELEILDIPCIVLALAGSLVVFPRVVVLAVVTLPLPLACPSRRILCSLQGHSTLSTYPQGAC